MWVQRAHTYVTNKWITTEKTRLIHKMARFVVGRLNDHFTVLALWEEQ
jgi:hypothetical protein